MVTKSLAMSASALLIGFFILSIATDPTQGFFTLRSSSKIHQGLLALSGDWLFRSLLYNEWFFWKGRVVRDVTNGFKDWEPIHKVNMSEKATYIIPCAVKSGENYFCSNFKWRVDSDAPFKNVYDESTEPLPNIYSDIRAEAAVLTFRNLTENNAGEYQCKCKEIGRKKWFSSSLQLIITGVPSPPSVTVAEPPKAFLYGGGSANCTVEAKVQRNDNVTVAWYYQGRKVPDAKRPRQRAPIQHQRTIDKTYRSTLYVPKLPRNVGTYTCLVSSDAHLQTKVARIVKVLTPPNTPTPTNEPTTGFHNKELIDVSIASSSPQHKHSPATVLIVVPCVLGVALFLLLMVILIIKNQSSSYYSVESAAVPDRTVLKENVDIQDKNAEWTEKKQDENKIQQTKKEDPYGIEFPRTKLTLGQVVGFGQFGVVREAEAQDIIPGQFNTKVAVKAAKDENDNKATVDLAAEATVMTKVGSHENIVSLLGVCSVNGPLWLIVEFSPHGNLKDYLQSKRLHRRVAQMNSTASRESAVSYKSTLTYSASLNPILERDMFWFGNQIANGMKYLESKQCVHRDLAARNILVFDNDVLKISDFGMAKDIHYFEYYKTNSTGCLPIRWTAPEALLYKTYTEASDVWSFGIVLWEIATLGGTPHPSIPVQRLFTTLTNSDYKMSRPRRCPQKLYEIMASCWNQKPEQRPQFSQIKSKLDDILEEMPLPVLQESELNQLSSPGHENQKTFTWENNENHLKANLY
eukprot:m.261154 g.261154  ORF g.261154 m.261154 type:complete len:747 (+) comp40443_c0_seq29:779-3019(+)